MAYIESSFDQDIRCRMGEVSAFEVFGHIIVKGLLIFLQREHIICLFTGNVVRYFILAAHDVNDNDKAFKGEKFQKRWDGSYLVAFVLSFDLSKDQAVPGSPDPHKAEGEIIKFV